MKEIKETDIKPTKAIDSGLTPQQELFCKLYATVREFFGNGTQAYIEAYNVDISKKGAYDVARSGAYENLTKPHILARIRELMETGILNDEFVDRELSFLIEQHAEKSVKLGAIREYNQLKARIRNKLEVGLDSDSIEGVKIEIVKKKDDTSTTTEENT